MEKLPVIFRAERSGAFKGDITAVFPTLETCYAHIGQHSGYSLDWYYSTRPAKPAEYASLLAEVRSIYERDGGTQLVIRQRRPTWRTKP